ncbi:programmed cell death protein 2 [Hypoxylon crocopeplum]|nr:programmed cell death protein 2 [Hypoxylon crocopeplum]
MAPYDSDSSADEAEDFAETNVLLGYASKDPGDQSISRLGGRPEWLDASNPPSAAIARCKICKDLMVLLLQLDGELPDRFPDHERRLYVFSCRRKTCRRREGSIRALRSMRIAPGSTAAVTTAEKKKEENAKPKEEKPKIQPPSNLGETLFGAKTIGSQSGSANPFSTTTSSSAGSNPFSNPGNPFSSTGSSPPVETTSEPKTDPPMQSTTAEALEALPRTFAQALSLNNDQPQTPTPSEPWPAESDQPAPYPVSYLSEAEYETLDPTPPPVPQNTRMDIDSSDGKEGGKGGKEDREVFESSMDAAFQRFADRLAQNPEQAIRYEFGGQPLLYSKTDAVGKSLALYTSHDPSGGLNTRVKTAGGTGMPRCANCSAPRTFEVQMTPHAIAELEADEMSLEGMDWGTVIVGVCGRDCQARGVAEGQVGYLEEWTGVQWEELSGGGRRS